MQRKKNKLIPRFSPERFTVLNRKGTRIVAKNKRHIITRNISHFKKFQLFETTRKEDDDYSDSDTEKSNTERETEEPETKTNDMEKRGNNPNVRPRRSRIPVRRYGFVIPSNLIN